jgi:hypothetical protein
MNMLLVDSRGFASRLVLAAEFATAAYRLLLEAPTVLDTNQGMSTAHRIRFGTDHGRLRPIEANHKTSEIRTFYSCPRRSSHNFGELDARPARRPACTHFPSNGALIR